MASQSAGTPTHALVSAVEVPDTGRTGIAVILRDERRDTVYSTSYTKYDTPLEAAAYEAIREAILTARENGSRHMTVYCDVEDVVAQLNRQQQPPDHLLTANLQLRALFNTFRYAKVKLAQSGNYFIAHKLAAGAAEGAANSTPLQHTLRLPSEV